MEGGVSLSGRTVVGDTAFGIARIGTTYVGVQVDHLSEVFRVTELSQLLVRSPLLSGGFDLRGHLIPVLDLTTVCGFERQSETGKFAVILRLDDRLLAFLVDEVIGISHVDISNVQRLQAATRPLAGADSVTVSSLPTGNVLTLFEPVRTYDIAGSIDASVGGPCAMSAAPRGSSFEAD